MELNLKIETISAEEFLGLHDRVARFVRANKGIDDKELLVDTDDGTIEASYPRPWSIQEDEKLIRWVEDGLDRGNIAKALDRELGAVYTRITKLRHDGKIPFPRVKLEGTK